MSGKEYGMLLLLGAIWGASFMFIKVGGEEMLPFALVEMRLGLAGIVLLAVNASRPGYFRALLTNWKPLVMMGLLNCAMPYVLITWGENYINSGLAAIYNACTPLWAAVLLAFMPASTERLNRLRFLGLLCGMAGVVLVVSGSLSISTESPLHIVGQAACLIAALSYACAGLFGKRFLAGVPTAVSATGQLITGAVMVLPIAIVQMPKQLPSWQALGAVTTLAVLGTAAASMMYYWLLTRVGATRVLLVTYLLPCFALVWGATLLGEPVTWAAVLGLALVLSGVAVTSSRGRSLAGLLGRFRGAGGAGSAGAAGSPGSGTGDLSVKGQS